ncbi:MAG: hypothetical protein J6V64_07330 [Burkholderiaceae bacterium]|nr:hypothetical protein [Burkholderiaceae bacterium]
MTNQSSLPSKLTVHDINERMEKPNLIFHGYCTDYRYGNFNHWEYSEAMFSDAWDKNDNPLNGRLAGHSIGHASDSIWQVRVTTQPKYHTLNDYAQTRVWVEPTNPINQPIPMELHHSDVLPSLLYGDIITAQVVLIPTLVRYVETKDPENMPYYRLEPIRVLNEEDPFKVKNHHVVHLSGGIHHVDWLPSTELEGEKVCVWMGTRFGDLCVIHPIDQIPEEDRAKIKERNFIVVQGVLTADCAIDDYQEGARHDAISYLSLLRDSLETARMFRFVRSMDPLCELEVSGETVVEFNNEEDHRQEIIEKLAQWFSHGEFAHGGFGRLILLDRKK